MSFELPTAAVLWPWSWSLLPVALAVGFVAGAVRGFAGFGFAALTVGGLSPFVPVGPVVAAAMVLEAIASAGIVRSVAKEVDRRWLRPLVIGNALCIPLGLAALAWLPPLQVRLLVGGGLLAAALALRITDGHHFAATPLLRGIAGVASGLLNGLAASGGVAAAMLMAATRAAPVQLRATMITFLMFVSLYALACAAVLSQADRAATTLLGADTVRWVLVLVPTMLLGIRSGRRAFGNAAPERYRRFVLNLLIVVSSMGLVSAAWSLWRA